MTEVIRDVLIRGRFEIEAGKVDPSFDKLTKRMSELEKRLRGSERAFDELGDTAKESGKEAGGALDELVDASNRLGKASKGAGEEQRKLFDAALRSGESLRTAGDGAFTFARGLALVGLEGSESIEEVTRRIADLQGKFDLFRGSVDVVRGGAEAFRSLSEAAEDAGESVGDLASEATLVSALLSPRGKIVLGVLAATAAVALLWRTFREDSKDALEESERYLAGLERQATKSADRIANAFRAADATRSLLEGRSLRASLPQEFEAIGPTRSFEEIARVNDVNALGIEGTRNQFSDDAEAERQIREDRTRALATTERNLANAERRASLQRQLITSTRSEFGASNTDRESDIAQRVQEGERLTDERDRVRERLAEAQRQQRERANQSLLERDSLSPSEAAFADRTAGNFADASSRDLQRLASLLPTEFGDRVRDERIRDNGGTPLERTDEVAELTAKLAELTEAIAGNERSVGRLEADDDRLDEQESRILQRQEALFTSLIAKVQELQNGTLELEAALQEQPAE